MGFPLTAPLGLILAGGLSRRMGGGTKTLLPLGRGTVLSSVIGRAEPQCGSLAVNANGDPGLFADHALRVLPDTVGDFAGPLAGVLAGLIHLHENGHHGGWLLTLPGDTPFIPADLVARLSDAVRSRGTLIARAASNGRCHPVVALWPCTLRTKLEDALVHRNVRSVMQFQAEVATGEAEWSTTPYDPFFNINTAEDLAEANRIAAEISPRACEL